MTERQLAFGLARISDPHTSQVAAHTSKSKWRAIVVEILDKFGPQTDPELCRLSGCAPEHWGSIKTARSWLTIHADPPVVVPTEEVRARCMVWRLASQRAKIRDARTGGYL